MKKLLNHLLKLFCGRVNRAIYMKPTIGRIVTYNTSEANREKQRAESHSPVGCNVQEKLPAMIVSVSGETVNLKVFHDGNGESWETSVSQGDEEGQWNWPVIGPVLNDAPESKVFHDESESKDGESSVPGN